MNNLTNEQALNILIQACRLAQRKGAFELEDAVTVKSAIDVFVKPQTPLDVDTSRDHMMVKDEPLKSVGEKEDEKGEADK